MQLTVLLRKQTTGHRTVISNTDDLLDKKLLKLIPDSISLRRLPEQDFFFFLPCTYLSSIIAFRCLTTEVFSEQRKTVDLRAASRIKVGHTGSTSLIRGNMSTGHARSKAKSGLPGLHKISQSNYNLNNSENKSAKYIFLISHSYTKTC
jgi:hypothetical protein